MKNKVCFYLIVLTSLLACVPQPEQVREVSVPAPIYPDYKNVTIPFNIAPLNFLFREEVSAVQVCVRGEQDSLVVIGKDQIHFPLKDWKYFLQRESGQTLTVELLVQRKDGWVRYPSFTWQVTQEPMDKYLSYRLIEPGYEVWNTIQLRERDVETFSERVIADNNLVDGSCMNCHIYGKQGGALSLFHLRGAGGGTIVNRDGCLHKLQLKNTQMAAAATYGEIHPEGRFAIFSSNVVIPAFHAKGSKRLEVYDSESDLVVVDLVTGALFFSPSVSGTETLETFPAFSADGRMVYFCSAPKVALPDSVTKQWYSLCQISFNPLTGEMGTVIDTLWNANIQAGSVCFPKASPDGNYLLYTVADYGTFPIWHRETDLQLMDLRTGAIDTLAAVNSDRSDTYHSWSSNSRWFVFASKRGDGQYGKPYFAYVDENGHVSKPFVLPQENPAHYDETLKSYNIPELSPTSVPFDAYDVKAIYEE